jgi:hypothetical protein
MPVKPLSGFAACRPNGVLIGNVFADKDGARSQAAFCHTDRSSIKLPRDWYRAYRAGWRVVQVELREVKGLT